VDTPLLPVLALVAGLLSCTSPCTLPLVPGYLSYMSGVSSARGRSLGAALLFVAGFSIVFTALGAAASGLGGLLLEHRAVIEKVAGAAIVVLGLFVLGLIRPAPLLREERPLLALVRPGPGGALLLGMAFAFGWTPCIGPVLAAILLLAGDQGTVASGAGLLLLYSIGMGIPFVLAALLLDRFRVIGRWLQGHGAALNAVGGLLLVAMGALVFAGRLNQVLAPALDLYAQLRWPPF
jgi:cytochrome c-type biogenesis protein